VLADGELARRARELGRWAELHPGHVAAADAVEALAVAKGV